MLSVPALVLAATGATVAPDPSSAEGSASPEGAVEASAEGETGSTPATEQLRRQLRRERAAHAAHVRRLSRQITRERASRKKALTKALNNTGTRDQVSHALRLASVAHGVPVARLRSVAHCESTLNPSATNGPYAGLFQFGTPLWSKTPYRSFSRSDPYAASQAAAWAFARGWSSHWGCA